MIDEEALKMGDMVLVSSSPIVGDNLGSKRLFVVKFRDKFYCEHPIEVGNVIGWEYMKRLPPEPQEIWMNEYPEGIYTSTIIYKTEAEARNRAMPTCLGQRKFREVIE